MQIQKEHNRAFEKTSIWLKYFEILIQCILFLKTKNCITMINLKNGHQLLSFNIEVSNKNSSLGQNIRKLLGLHHYFPVKIFKFSFFLSWVFFWKFIRNFEVAFNFGVEFFLYKESIGEDCIMYENKKAEQGEIIEMFRTINILVSSGKFNFRRQFLFSIE